MADSINYQLAKFVASYGKVSQIPEYAGQNEQHQLL